MPNANNISEWIEINKICGYLSKSDIYKKKQLGVKIMDELLPRKLNILQTALQFGYTYDNGSEALDLVNGYNIALCGMYSLEAQSIMGHGGGTIVQYTNQGAIINVDWQIVELVVGDASQANPAGSPTPNDGDTQVTINFKVVPQSENIFYQGVPVKLSTGDDFYYTAAYGLNSTIYTFSQPLTDGFAIKFDFAKIVGQAQGSGVLIGNALQAIGITVPTTGNTITLGVLGTFVMAVMGAVAYDSNYINQVGTTLDFTNVGGVTAGQVITVFYYPPQS